MDNKIKIKGRLKTYLQWTLFMGGLFIVMSIWLVTVDRRAGLIASGFSVFYFIVALSLYFVNKTRLLGELVFFAADYGQIQKRLLHQLSIPYALLDDKGRIVWMNELFGEVLGKEKSYGKSITSFFPNVTKKSIPEDEKAGRLDLSYGERDYQVELKKLMLKDLSVDGMLEVSECEGFLVAMYLFDVTELNKYKQKNKDQQLVAGLIYMDNYDEAMDSVEEVRRSLLTALVDRKVNQYMGEFDGLVRKLEKDKYFVVVQHKYLEKMQETKFAILEEVKKISIGNTMPVTLSIGIGFDGSGYSKCYHYARNAIDLALGRGGDQAVVKTKNAVNYYGGKAKQVEKYTRVKARVKAQALCEIIESKDKVFVMGHAMADNDSFGAAVGIYRAAMALNRKAHIVINEITSSVRPMIECFYDNKDYPEDMFLNSEQAVEWLDSNSVVVVVDVNKPSITECQELLRLAKTIVVFDHHRQGKEVINNAVLSYIETYASSTCEMVAEILQYVVENIKMKPLEADCMYAGMLIDTDNFMNKTGVRTFEAAAFLRRCGADVSRVRKLFREDVNTYKAKAEAISSMDMYNGCFAITVSPEHIEGGASPTIVAAQTADDLLDILGVKASFVLTRYQSKIYISARSIDEVNVQIIMEQLGGGGHQTVAGAQLEGYTIQEAVDILKATLKKMQQEGDI